MNKILNFVSILAPNHIISASPIIPPIRREQMVDINQLMTSEKIIGWKVWSDARRVLAAKQLVMRDAGIDVGQIDGLFGPVTDNAIHTYNGTAKTRADIEKSNRDGATKTPLEPHPVWPRQTDVEKFYGAVGKNQTTVLVPWRMVLAWDKTKAVQRITIHQKCAPSLKRILDRINNEISDAQKIELGLNLFGGSLNVRKMRGSNAWSMHSWGIAIDFDPERNQLAWGRDKARLAKPDAEKFWSIWEDEGWVSLGRQRNFDWMHVQASRL